METSSEVRLGLTKPFIRLAYYYLTKGFGSHTHSTGNELYDVVDVSPLYDWQSNPENEEEFGAGVRVTFYHQGQKVRWVEFAIRYGGGGGKPAIFLQPS